jgi:predicted ATP-grasp superfamily ATP-dependent carboligase
MGELLRWISEPPVLRRPVVVVALEGFVDAGRVGETAGMFLRHRWQAEVVATFQRDAFIDYRARRPTAVVDAGRLRRVEWPTIELLTAGLDGQRDVVFLLGPEPDMRWEAFGDSCVEAVRRLGVDTVVALGAYPAAVPHTRPAHVTKAFAGEAGSLLPDVAPIAGYTGPVGAATTLQAAFAEAGMSCVGLWVEVPHYIAGAPNPDGALALVRLVSDFVGAAVDTTELEAAAKVHREQVDEAIANHSEAAELVRLLEAHVDAGGGVDLPTGEELAAEIERFLRGQAE